MAELWIKKVILAFVTLIVGIVLISTVSTQEQAVTTLGGIVNESVDISSAVYTSGGADSINETYPLTLGTLGDTNTDCPVTLFALGNSTETFTLVSGTDYTFNSSTGGSGQFFLLNTSDTVNLTNANNDNLTSANYTYCPTGYITQGWGRTTADLVPGFFAIALMLVAVGLFFSVYMDFKRR